MDKDREGRGNRCKETGFSMEEMIPLLPWRIKPYNPSIPYYIIVNF